MTILYSTEAVFVASHSVRVDQDTVQSFYLLASWLMNRLRLFNQPSDAQHCVQYFRCLESLPLEAFGLSSDEVKVCLVVALASQVRLGIGDATRNIDEMMDRFRDLLTSNIPQRSLREAINALISVTDDHSHHSPAPEYSEILIDRLREANLRLSSHDPYVAKQLAIGLSIRFRATHSIDDYKEAMALFDKIITSDPNRDCPGPDAASALFFSAILAGDRATILDNPECLEEAIYRNRKFLRIPSTDDFECSMATWMLATLIEKRSSHFGITGERLSEAPSPDPESTSFHHLLASLRARSTIDKTHWWMVSKERAEHIRALETVCRTTDITEIAEAIEYCRLLLASTPPSEDITFYPARALGKVLSHAFKCTDNIEYLNKSISAFRNMLEMPTAKWGLFSAIVGLHNALSFRWSLSEDEKDFDEMMQLCSMASRDPYTNVLDKLKVSYGWAENARRERHHTTSTAYETALSLMEDTLLFAPTLETQHLHLVSRRNVYEELPRNMASYEVSRGRLPDAIQALERGRALIWSEMRGFRASIHQGGVCLALS